MSITLFILSAVLTARYTYLLATDSFENYCREILARAKHSMLIIVFTVIEMLLIFLNLAGEDHKVIVMTYVLSIHNILFGITPTATLLDKKGLRYLFLSVNILLYLVFTIIYAYKLWIGTH